MTHLSWPRLFTTLLGGLVVYTVCGGALAASRLTRTTDAALDQLIPRENWTADGLDKLTAPEQQKLAGEITALLGGQERTQNELLTGKDRSQWRKLQRRMSKDDVKKLLGEPFRASASRYCEYWEYFSGTVTFDSKGHLDFWSET